MPPSSSLAVIVTVVAARSSVALYDQLQVPAVSVSALTTEPSEALNVTVSPAFPSDQVPVLEAVAPSFTVTDALVGAMVGGVLAGVRRN